MALRVEVFPYDVAIEEGSPRSSQNPLFVCLATSSAEDGTVLTVGRKEADVSIKDKTVSRKHMSLRLVSNVDNHHTLLADDGNVIAGAADQPKSPEETEACEGSSDGLVVVLCELGSKFGTYIAVPKNEAGTKARQETDDDVDTGEETEDEADMSSGLALSSNASKLVQHPRESIMQRLPSTGSSRTVLNSLSDPGESVVIQVGQMGSLIRLTRIDLKIAWSLIDNSERKAWAKRFYAIGASSADSCEDMTHLVTSKKEPTAKHLIAWSSSKPTVSQDFLKALYTRNASDPLPRADLFAPKGEPLDFWETTPNPRLWSKLTMISLVNDDIASLCRAAGVKLISLQNIKMKDFKERVADAKKCESGCFFVDSSSRKLTKFVKELKEQGIPFVTQKKVAACITEQEMLTDTHGNPIVATAVEDDNGEEVAIEGSKSGVKGGAGLAAESNDEPSRAGGVVSKISKVEDTTKDVDRPGDKYDKDLHVTVEDKEASERHSNRKRAIEHSNRTLEERTDVASKRPKTLAGKGNDEAKQNPRRQKREVDDENHDPREERTGKRKKLQVSSGGWLVTAPSGSKRGAYRRTTEEIVETMAAEAEILVAPTEKRSDLIVKKKVSSDAYASTRNSSGYSGVDFKKFRKNSVLRGKSRSSNIQMRSVLPKESEQQRELEMQQRHLDEEMRVAEELFSDPSGGRVRDFFKPRGKRGSTRAV